MFIIHHIIIIRTRQYQRTRRPLRPSDVHGTVCITNGQEYHSIFALNFFFTCFLTSTYLYGTGLFRLHGRPPNACDLRLLASTKAFYNAEGESFIRA